MSASRTAAPPGPPVSNDPGVVAELGRSALLLGLSLAVTLAVSAAAQAAVALLG